MSEKHIQKFLDGDKLTDNQISKLLSRTIPLEQAFLCTGARYKPHQKFTITLNDSLKAIAEARGIAIPESIEFTHKVTSNEADQLLHSLQFSGVTSHQGELEEIRQRIAPALIERMSKITAISKPLGSFYYLVTQDIGRTIVQLMSIVKKGSL